MFFLFFCFFFQAEAGIRDAQESRGLGDVYKRQLQAEMFKFPVNNHHSSQAKINAPTGFGGNLSFQKPESKKPIVVLVKMKLS